VREWLNKDLTTIARAMRDGKAEVICKLLVETTGLLTPAKEIPNTSGTWRLSMSFVALVI